MHDRGLYRELQFASFPHYVREGLGMSPRTAARLIRIERNGHKYPPLADAYRSGKLTPLKAELLVRVLGLGIFPEAQQAWVVYAHRMSFRQLGVAVRWAERQAADPTDNWANTDGLPPTDSLRFTPTIPDQLPTFATFDAGARSDSAPDGGETGTGSPTFATFEAKAAADPQTFATFPADAEHPALLELRDVVLMRDLSRPPLP